MKPSHVLLTAGLLGLVGVSLGAFGAHALRQQLTELGTRDRWETAVHYHLLHTVAIFAAGIGMHAVPGKAKQWLGRAVVSWTIGIFLFSGSLYLLSLKAPAWLGASAAPLGGVVFLCGWACVAAAGWTKEMPTR